MQNTKASKPKTPAKSKAKPKAATPSPVTGSNALLTMTYTGDAPDPFAVGGYKVAIASTPPGLAVGKNVSVKDIAAMQGTIRKDIWRPAMESLVHTHSPYYEKGKDHVLSASSMPKFHLVSLQPPGDDPLLPKISELLKTDTDFHWRAEPGEVAYNYELKEARYRWHMSLCGAPRLTSGNLNPLVMKLDAHTQVGKTDGLYVVPPQHISHIGRMPMCSICPNQISCVLADKMRMMDVLNGNNTDPDREALIGQILLRPTTWMETYAEFARTNGVGPRVAYFDGGSGEALGEDAPQRHDSEEAYLTTHGDGSALSMGGIITPGNIFNFKATPATGEELRAYKAQYEDLASLFKLDPKVVPAFEDAMNMHWQQIVNLNPDDQGDIVQEVKLIRLALIINQAQHQGIGILMTNEPCDSGDGFDNKPMNMLMPIRGILPNARPEDLPPIFWTYEEVMTYFLPIRGRAIIAQVEGSTNNPFLRPEYAETLLGDVEAEALLDGESGHFVKGISNVYSPEERAHATDVYLPAYVRKHDGLVTPVHNRGDVEGMRFELGETLRERKAAQAASRT